RWPPKRSRRVARGLPGLADERSGDSAVPSDSVPATGAELVRTHRGRHFAQGERGGRRIAHPERSEAGEENVVSDAVIGETESKGRPGVSPHVRTNAPGAPQDPSPPFRPRGRSSSGRIGAVTSLRVSGGADESLTLSEVKPAQRMP